MENFSRYWAEKGTSQKRHKYFCDSCAFLWLILHAGGLQCREHPRIPDVRAGLASGDLLLRDGDVFGPVVNLAARAVETAGPGDVVAPIAFARAAGMKAGSSGAQQLKGLDTPIELSQLIDPRE